MSFLPFLRFVYEQSLQWNSCWATGDFFRTEPQSEALVLQSFCLSFSFHRHQICITALSAASPPPFIFNKHHPQWISCTSNSMLASVFWRTWTESWRKVLHDRQLGSPKTVTTHKWSEQAARPVWFISESFTDLFSAITFLTTSYERFLALRRSSPCHLGPLPLFCLLMLWHS